jgi:hypothetical protein
MAMLGLQIMATLNSGKIVEPAAGQSEDQMMRMRLLSILLFFSVAANATAQEIVVDHLYSPHRIAFDRAGHRLYICQPELGETDAFDLDSHAQSLLLKEPANGITVDQQGRIYLVSDLKVQQFDPVSGRLTLIAGSDNPLPTDPRDIFPVTSGDGGPATLATLGYAQSVSIDSLGNVYIGEYKGMKVRRVDAATGIITTVAGTGAIGYSGDGGDGRKAKFGPITDLLVDRNDDLLIVDSFNERIRRLDHLTGIVSTIACDGTYDDHTGDNATTSSFERPLYLASDEAGNLYISQFNGAVKRIDATTQRVITVANNLGTIEGIAVAHDGSLYYSHRHPVDPFNPPDLNKPLTLVGQVLRLPSCGDECPPPPKRRVARH